MPLTGEEIRHRLIALAERWSVYEGSERAEAQTFLNELFACYGQNRAEVATFEEPQAGGFIDLIWPRRCIIEMKRPSEADRLIAHRQQALGYWRASADPEAGIPAPDYVVICAFKRMEIWEPGRFPNEPRVVLDLVELRPQPGQTSIVIVVIFGDARETGARSSVNSGLLLGARAADRVRSHGRHAPGTETQMHHCGQIQACLRVKASPPPLGWSADGKTWRAPSWRVRGRFSANRSGRGS